MALARGQILAEDLGRESFSDPEVRRLAESLSMVESVEANDAFPKTRLAKATLTLVDGSDVTSDWHTPKWDAATPPTDTELMEKFLSFAPDQADFAKSMLGGPLPNPKNIVHILGSAFG